MTKDLRSDHQAIVLSSLAFGLTSTTLTVLFFVFNWDVATWAITHKEEVRAAKQAYIQLHQDADERYKKLITPLPENAPEATPEATKSAEPTPSPTTTPKPKQTSQTKVWEGKASWYGTGEKECLGCHPEMIMANGQKLDDTKHTIAFNRLPLGSKVRVYNVDNGLFVDATVTDTGGFERHDKIADLTKAVRDAIGGKSTTNVRIEQI